MLGGLCVSLPWLLGVCRTLGPRRAGACSWVGSGVLWGCPVVVRLPAVLVSPLVGLWWVAGLSGGLRFAAGGWLSCVLVRRLWVGCGMV